MGRRLKVPRGLVRTTLLRSFHVEQLDGAAERLGCDFSDVVRATIDMLFPSDSDDLRVRTQAAIERNRRYLMQISSDLIPVLINGWIGKEMMLPMEFAKRPSIAGLIEETAKMLRRLEPSALDGAFPPMSIPNSSLSRTADEILVVLSSPAVRVIEFAEKKKHPTVFLASFEIWPQSDRGAVNKGTGPTEVQYEEPHVALAALTKSKRVQDVSDEYLGRVGCVFRCSAFRIDWDRCRETD